MIEFYKEVARYRADIEHAASGTMIDFRAVVYEGPGDGQFTIRYSHTLISKPGAGAYYSNSASRADNPGEAETLIKSWAASLSKAHEIVPWVEDL